mmetsp:Transcript_25438/g.58687  ORF Transcript_25438/g.58687 Transcript_25438/m.58687 type:complete len:202 (-) Transcript_25438:268-873(-)
MHWTKKFDHTQKSDIVKKKEILGLRQEISIFGDAIMKVGVALLEHLKITQREVPRLQNCLSDITAKFFLTEGELEDAQQMHTDVQKKIKDVRTTSKIVKRETEASIRQLVSYIENLRKSLRLKTDELGDAQIIENISEFSHANFLTDDMIHRKMYCLQVENVALHELLSVMRNSRVDKDLLNDSWLSDYSNCCTCDVDDVV